MTDAARAIETPPLDFENETDEAIIICGGDVRAALKATLVANAFLEAELARVTEMVSAGYGRGQVRKPAKRQPRVTRTVVSTDDAPQG
ncbi:MAG: hypothetical protein AB7O60_03675 [Variibacter sp.]